jgi:hypothetical protein
MTVPRCRAGRPPLPYLSSACAGISAARIRSEVGFVPPSPRSHRHPRTRPVYADRNVVAMCPHAGLILDLHLSRDGRAVFVTRPESAAEWQQCILSDRARRD